MGAIYDRHKGIIEEEEYEQNLLRFFYENVIGRCFLKVIILPFFSKAVGKYFNTSWSTRKIKRFVQKNQIDMSEYKPKEYHSFNDFFSREKEKVTFDTKENILCSPADARVLVYSIADDLKIKIKNSVYSLEELIKDSSKSLREFQNGHCLVFRLSVNDYHRYHYVDDGTLLQSDFIKGKLHTVRSISEKYKVYSENCRVVNLLETKHFGKMYMIEVGALLVGKIKNHEIVEFQKGQEKGYFEFGGSTIVLLTKSNIQIDDDIIQNSNKNVETKVNVGERIGKI